MPSAPRKTTNLSARAFQWLLALYPAAFRDEYGRELALVFVDRYRDADGRWDRIRLWLEVLAGIVTEAPKEHVRMLSQDLRHAVRRLRKSPGFATISVATLALAIGASTAMFSVLNAVVLRPLPYPSPEQLAMVWTEIPSQGTREGRSAYGTVEQWRRQSQSFAELAVFDPVSAVLTRSDETDQIGVARVSPNFFPMHGVQLVRGRAFSEVEADQRQRVAVISHRFWQTRFGGSDDAIGASIELDGVASQIIGVLPAGAQSLGDADVWEPHTLFPDWETRRAALGVGSWFVIGRLRPNITLEQAQSEMSAIARRLDEQLPAALQNRGVSLVPLSEHVTGSRPRLALWLLNAAAFCVLLIAAANVAGLSLARTAGRAPEMAIRAALGASRARIVRQLLAESVTLAGISGVVGLLLAVAGIELVRAFPPGNLVRLQEISLDLRVVGWASAVSLLTGVMVGLAPAITMSRRSLRATGDEGGRGIVGSAAARGIRRALVVAQCAVVLVLLIGAGLLVRSWWQLMQVDPGFRPDRVLSMSIATPASTQPAQRATFYERVLEHVAALPGVESAGVSSELFIGGVSERILTAEGDSRTAPERFRFRSDEVSGGFFTALGTPLLSGRFFSIEDGPAAPPVAIVNAAMARRVWPDRDPLGRRFTIGPPVANPLWFTVVGVVGDMRRQGLETEPIPQMFQPLAQNPSRRAILFVRTSIDEPLEIVGTLRAAVHGVDARAPVYAVTTLDERLGGFLSQRRLQTSLLIGFAMVALLLATIGIYGLIQHSVASRTHEIGIRMAVGAQAGDILRMIIREGLTLSLTGLVFGLVAAVWLGQAGSSLLFGVTATDPVTFVAAAMLLTAVAAAACYIPARRAMKVEPIVALQQRV